MNIRLLFFCLLTPFFSSAQDPGEQIFDGSFLHEIRITFDNNDFWEILTNNYNNALDPNTQIPDNVPYESSTIMIDGTLLEQVGVRQKGFSSHFFANFYKKSLKLDFNEFNDTLTYDGLKKVNLHNGVADPAYQRDFLAYDILRKEGIKVPRVSFCELFLNDQFWGIYTIVEQIDKTFLRNNFPDEDGNLYKNIGFSDLSWLGNDPASYQAEIELKTNEDDPDAWLDFINFLDVLNNSSDEEFAAQIQTVFDVDSYLKILAVDVSLSNWDSYLEHGRNFYLYSDPTTGLIKWIPWDYNLALGGTFGLTFGGGDLPSDLGDCMSIENGSCPYQPEDSILQIVFNEDDFCCNVFWTSSCQALYNTISTDGWLPADRAECVSLNDGSSPLSINDVLYHEVIETAPECCQQGWTADCDDLYDNLVADPNYEFLDLSLFQEESEKVLVTRLLSVPEFYDQYLENVCLLLEDNMNNERLDPIIDFNADLIADKVPLDSFYLFDLQYFYYDISEGTQNGFMPSLKEIIRHRNELLSLTLESENISCQPVPSPVAFGDIVINEFVASMDSTSDISDQDGDFDDWIELYNNTSDTISLGAFYLSDNFSDPKKWNFPDTTSIAPFAYKIVWADSDPLQTGLHTNFKLSKAGEEILFTHEDGTVIDSVSYFEQSTNIASARIPNGTGPFVQQEFTFGINNVIVSSTSELSTAFFKLYPNPTNGIINIKWENAQNSPSIVKGYNAQGSLVYSNNFGRSDLQTIDFSPLQNGMYFLTIEKNGKVFTEKILLNKKEF